MPIFSATLRVLWARVPHRLHIQGNLFAPRAQRLPEFKFCVTSAGALCTPLNTTSADLSLMSG